MDGWGTGLRGCAARGAEGAIGGVEVGGEVGVGRELGEDVGWEGEGLGRSSGSGVWRGFERHSWWWCVRDLDGEDV